MCENNFEINAKMSIEGRVEEWLRKMGYDGDIPSSLSKICNPSTAFIWEQLMSNVKSRQEADVIKKTIIVNRLLKKSLEEQDQFSYPIKEIEVYKEKQKLEKRIESLEKTIEEKEEIVDDLLQENKKTYMRIENIKAKIRENEEKTFLLHKKSKLLEKDIEQRREVLTMARNLTPVEMEASAYNSDEITRTLQKCAEKLQLLSDGFSISQTNKTASMSTSTMTTAKKPTYISKGGTISRYVSQSTVLSEIAPSTHKKMNHGNKENLNFTKHTTAVSRCLKFLDSGDEKNTPETEKTPKRESLGLLSANCLDTSDDLDNFLLRSNNSEDTVCQLLTDSLLEPSTKNTNNELLHKFHDDENVKQLLKDLLHKNNRCLIMTQCGNIYEHLLNEVRASVMDFSNLVGSYSSKRSINQSDLSELYFVHIKNELEKDKCKILLKKLQEAVKRKKEEIFVDSGTPPGDDFKTTLDLQIEDAYLNGANNFLSKQIDCAKKNENDTDVEAISLKIKQTQEDIVVKGSDIQNMISVIYKILEDIRNNQTETSMCVKKLAPYFQNFAWANMMTQGTNSREIEIFDKFPLEFNRKFRNGYQSDLCYRHISDTAIPSYVKLDAEILDTVTKLIDTPFSTAEGVICDVLRTKVLANKLLSIKPSTEFLHLDYQKYSLEELRKKEEYVESVINKLDSIINSNSVNEVLSAPNSMQEIAEMWLEMPFKNVISERRQVDGRGYKYYEKILEERKKHLN